MTDTISIHLTIGSKTYPLKVLRSEEHIYREAAQIINTKIRNYIINFTDQQTEDYLAMALIDITSQLVTEQVFDKELLSMIDSIDNTLKLNNN